MNPNEKINASVYIITWNEEKNLPRALKSVCMFDQIVVVDSGSSDRTAAIARGCTPCVYTHEWQGFSRQKDYAKSLCTHEWVLNMDADEEVDAALLTAIRKTVETDSADALIIRIRDAFQGRLAHPRTKHHAKIRFFKKSKGRYSDSLVHEGVIVKGRIAKAKGFINHFGEVSIETKVDKNNRYSSLRAEEKFLKRKHPSPLKLFTVFPATFFKSFILRRNFLNGKRGFVGSTINAFYAFLKEAKLDEKYGGKG